MKKSRKKFDASIPRWSYWKEEINFPGRCPRCNTRLKTEQHPYLVITRGKGEMKSLVIGSDGGSFCSQCPIVVLDIEVFIKLIRLLGCFDHDEFIVLGIIDLEAVSKEKNIVFGDDNSLPLVKFLNFRKDSSALNNSDSKIKKPFKRIKKKKKRR